jgi:ketosteroid isomerase-like protein
MIPGTEDTIRIWLHRLWNERDPSVIEELFMPDGCAEGLDAKPIIGPKEFRAFWDLLAGAIVETNVDIEHIMTKGDEALLVASFRGVHRETRSEVHMRFAAHAIVREGKIVDATNVLDALGLLQQIGKAERDALPAALA